MLSLHGGSLENTRTVPLNLVFASNYSTLAYNEILINFLSDKSEKKQLQQKLFQETRLIQIGSLNLFGYPCTEYIQFLGYPCTEYIQFIGDPCTEYIQFGAQ